MAAARSRYDHEIDLSPKWGLITSTEAAEYSDFVEQGNRLTLRKAWVANILTDRGSQISKSDFAPGDT